MSEAVVDAVEVPEKSRLDHLEAVLDAQLQGDTSAATASFHDYITMTTQNILNPVSTDDVDPMAGVVADEVVDTALADVELDDVIDGVDVTDIDIEDHIPAE